MKRRRFIQACSAVGAAIGLASNEVLGESATRTARSIGSRSLADVGAVPTPGRVAAISGPGTDAPNTMSDVMYLQSAGGGTGNGNNYFGNWCSGVYAPDDGTYGSIVFSNGGDGDYWGNEVYKFALDTRVWSRECSRSPHLNGVTTAGGDPNFDEIWGEHKTPGGAPPPQPGVPHSYDQMEYLPPHLGGGSRGSFMFPTRTIVYRYRRFHHPHVFDLNIKAWRRGSARAGIVGFGNSDSPTWCFDSRRNRFWGLMGGLTGIWNNALRYLDFDRATGLATAGAVSIPTFLSPDGYPTSRYWPTGDLMLVAGRSGGAFKIFAGPLEKVGAGGFSSLVLSGAIVPGSNQGYGLAYCQDLDCFFVRTSSGHRQKIWKVIPPGSNYLTRPWVVEEITMSGDTVAAKDNVQGMWKRFMYVSPLKCLMWVDDIKGAVYAYRPVTA